MKAIILKQPGGIENLIEENIDAPTVVDEEVLVQIKSISINPVDVKSRKGKGIYGRLKEESKLILGWDISGIVVETSPSVTKFKKGDDVFGMVNFPGHGKAYAEFVAVKASDLALKPTNISHEEAAAATLAALTAYQALVKYATIKKGNRVLIHSAAGGVGHYAVQIAKYLGAYVIGTASAVNKNFITSIGADEHIDYQTKRFEEEICDVDFVLDTIGGDNIDRSLEVIKNGGAIISIPSGLNAEVVEKAKARGITGSFMLVSSNGEDMEKLAELLQKGIIKSHVSAVFPFHEIGKAHLQVETGKTRGKVVVSV
jgi:NADPH:quinone reductase-like Zn-dependent oxidoreductase